MKLKLLPLAVSLLCSAVQPAFAADFPTSANVTSGTTLEDFFTAAINYSPELNIARERWNIGDSRIDQANGQLLPQVNANGSVSENRRDEGTGYRKYDGQNYSVQLSQVLFNWQAFASRQQAYLYENQVESEFFAQLAVLLTVVADTYLTVLQAEDALRSIDSELEATTNQVNQIQQLYDRQLAQITALYDGQAQLAAVSAERVDVESELMIQRENLRAISGIDVGPLRRLPEEISVTPLDGTLEQWLQSAEANNKEIEAMDYALQVAQKAVSRQRSVYLPRVSLVVQHQTSDIGFQNTQMNRADTNYVGIDVTLPLFAGGSNRASVREALSQRNIAESQLRQTSLDIYDRARTAYFQVKAGESRIGAAQLLEESTTTAYTAMQRGFELGTVTSVDVLNALRDRFNAQRDLQRARYDHIRATLLLRREAGTLSAEDMQAISNMLNAPAPAQ
jgi:outer membrane protein